MAYVHFTQNLKRFFPDLAAVEVAGDSAATIVLAIEEKFPGIARYIVDERGSLRGHVNIFVDGHTIVDREALSDRIEPNAIVHIIQALSGG